MTDDAPTGSGVRKRVLLLFVVCVTTLSVFLRMKSGPMEETPLATASILQRLDQQESRLERNSREVARLQAEFTQSRINEKDIRDMKRKLSELGAVIEVDKAVPEFYAGSRTLPDDPSYDAPHGATRNTAHDTTSVAMEKPGGVPEAKAAPEPVTGSSTLPKKHAPAPEKHPVPPESTLPALHTVILMADNRDPAAGEDHHFLLSGFLTQLYAAANPGTLFVMYHLPDSPGSPMHVRGEILHGTWTKVVALLRALHDFPSATTFLFVDGDSIFSPGISLATFLHQLHAVNSQRGVANHPVVLAADPDGWLTSVCDRADLDWCVNSGAILIQCGLPGSTTRNQTIALMQRWWRSRHDGPEDVMKDPLGAMGEPGAKEFNANKMSEQNRLIYVLNSENRWMNSTVQFTPLHERLPERIKRREKEKEVGYCHEEQQPWNKCSANEACLQRVDAGINQDFDRWVEDILQESFQRYSRASKQGAAVLDIKWPPKWNCLVLHYCEKAEHKTMAMAGMMKSIPKRFNWSPQLKAIAQGQLHASCTSSPKDHKVETLWACQHHITRALFDALSPGPPAPQSKPSSSTLMRFVRATLPVVRVTELAPEIADSDDSNRVYLKS